jgi:hypothetical protein
MVMMINILICFYVLQNCRSDNRAVLEIRTYNIGYHFSLTGFDSLWQDTLYSNGAWTTKNESLILMHKVDSLLSQSIEKKIILDNYLISITNETILNRQLKCLTYRIYHKDSYISIRGFYFEKLGTLYWDFPESSRVIKLVKSIYLKNGDFYKKDMNEYQEQLESSFLRTPPVKYPDSLNIIDLNSL